MAKSTDEEATVDVHPYTRTPTRWSAIHTQCFSQNKRQVVHQTIFSIAFLLTNIFGTVMVYQHKSLSVPGDLHNLKGLHGHFNITQHLTIQKASCSRTLDPWKWSQAETLCAHPASQFFSRCPSLLTLGHEFSRQPHHHSLLSSDMAFPMNPTFLGQVFPLLKVTSRNIWALLCHRHTHFHKQATVSFHFTFCEPLHQWKHHRKTYRCTIYTGSSRLQLTCHVLQCFSYLRWKWGKLGSNTLSKGAVGAALNHNGIDFML